MYPILFEIGPLQIPGYGVTLVLSFLLVTLLARKEALRFDLHPERLVDVAVAGLLIGLLGAKLLLIFIDLPKYIEDPKLLIGTIRSAGVVYGGLIAGALGAFYFIRRYKLPFWRTLDVLAPFTAMGLGLGRISCMFAGCCYGFPYEGPLALHFPDHPLCDAPAHIGLFPVQVVDLFNGLILFGILLYILRRHYRFEGQVLLTFLFLYGLTRGLVEFLRGDSVRGLWFGGHVSTSQVISLVVMALSLALFAYKRKFELKKEAPL